MKPFYVSKGQHAIFISPSPRGKPIRRLTKEIIKTSIGEHKHTLEREREREGEDNGIILKAKFLWKE